MDTTDSQGIVEEPSASAQEDALQAAENAAEVIIDDGIAAFPTAEQGMTEEPSAEAQDAMANE